MNGKDLLDSMDLIDINLIEEADYSNKISDNEINSSSQSNKQILLLISTVAASALLCFGVNRFTGIKQNHYSPESDNSVFTTISQTETITKASDSIYSHTDKTTTLINTSSSETVSATTESITSYSSVTGTSKKEEITEIPVIITNSDLYTQSMITEVSKTTENTTLYSVISTPDSEAISTTSSEETTPADTIVTSETTFIADSPADKYKIIRNESGDIFCAMALAEKSYIGEKYETVNIIADNNEFTADIYFINDVDLNFARIVNLDDNFIVYRNMNFLIGSLESTSYFDIFTSYTGINISSVKEICYKGNIYSDDKIKKDISDLIFEPYQYSSQINSSDITEPDGYILYELKYAPGFYFKIYLYDEEKIMVSLNEQKYFFAIQNANRISAYLKAAEHN